MLRRRPDRKGNAARPVMPPADLASLLAEGAVAMGRVLSAQASERLLAYLDLLVKWNGTYNLTAVRKPEQMITRHLLDSLTVLPYVQSGRILDVGTGAGLPGLPLAVVLTDSEVVLLDSNRKKTRFVVQAISELGLDNIRVVTERVEDYRTGDAFDTVISRAFSTVGDMLQSAGHLCRAEGVFLAMKGVYPLAELETLPQGYRVETVQALRVPGLDAERHLVVCRHVQIEHATPV